MCIRDRDTTIEKLNDLYHTFESLPLDLQEDYGELMCYFTSLDELHQHRHDVIHYSWCKNMADVARHLSVSYTHLPKRVFKDLNEKQLFEEIAQSRVKTTKHV